MNLINPSAMIMHELEGMELGQRIEACGRICYKSENKITHGSSEKFVRDIIKRGHNSVLEMATITIEVMASSGAISEFYSLLPKYLVVDWLMPEHILITGSVRAFRELCEEEGCAMVVNALAQELHKLHPDLFNAPAITGRSTVAVRQVSDGELHDMMAGTVIRHRHMAVKFIVNRAVSHEIVRHRPCSFLQESQRYCRYDSDKFGNQVTFIKPCFYKDSSPEYMFWYTACLEAESLYLKLLKTSSPQAARTVLPNSCKTEIIVYASLKQWQHMFTLRTSLAADPSMREVMNTLLVDFMAIYPEYFDFIEAAA